MADETHDDDDIPCARHPKRMTALRCSNCETPICPDCSVVAAVGLKCPDCGKLPKSARAVMPTAAFVRAIFAAVFLGAAGGAAFLVFKAQVGFLTLIVAYILGIIIGEGVIRASGGFKDATTTKIAVLGASLGLLSPLVLAAVFDPKVLQEPNNIWFVIAAGIAGYAAGTRTAR